MRRYKLIPMVHSLLKLISRPIRALWRPSLQVARLAERAHWGEISIEELTSAPASRGRLAPLVKVIGEILLDLRQQRAHLVELEHEIRDRIANRTDVLERRIGALQLQASRDPLTGLGNRRALDSDLPAVIDRHRHNGVNLCLLMIDIDHFKPLNDTLGHAAGDRLLREIGQLIRSTLRGDDQAYRCGGDEFVVLLHACDAPTGISIARRLESLVKGLTKRLTVAYPPQLSIGISALSELSAPSVESLIAIADSRLYEVKGQRPRTRRSA